jgi:7,8-dihydropterin-6-yl-methyl-4-(beta-D-ribofuranosyl)aminobenzene 5'-phosphate synthase
MYKIIVLGIAVFLALTVVQGGVAEDMTIHIVYNNVAYDQALSCRWGMGCVIEGFEKTILFDTGGDGAALLSNMERMGIDPGGIEVVVLSHIHGDHTGGLQDFLSSNSDVVVYVPSSFPSSFKRNVTSRGARVVEVSKPTEILPNVYSTGELGTWIKEQALVLRGAEGLVVVTGCAHPGVVVIAERAVQILDQEIYLITGGFHLGGASGREIERIVSALQVLGVRKIAPSHCTGETATQAFKQAWGRNFLEGGCGARITVPLAAARSD